MGLSVLVWLIALVWSFWSLFTTDPDTALSDPMDHSMAAGDAAANTAASVLVYGLGILIAVLIVLWISMTVASRRALREPPDAQRQAAYEARMARLIPEYDRIVAEYKRRHGRDPAGCRVRGPAIATGSDAN